jgi:hypothetical protein
MRASSTVFWKSILCFSLFTSAFAQTITRFPDEQRDAGVLSSAQRDAARADLDQRSALAERLVSAKELPGREFPAEFRAALIEGLKRETYQQLQERIGTGNIASMALGDTKSDLVYTTFQQPCRIIDTRLGGGIIASMQIREFDVVALPADGLAFQGGSPTGCGIPFGATVVQINFVAVSPVGGGNLKGSAYPLPIPVTGSVLNYQLLPGLNVANGLLFPICDPTTAAECHVDIKLQANGAATHVVADVLGYAMRFPREKVKNVITLQTRSGTVSIGPTCTNFTGFSFPFTAPANGTVRVRGNVQLIVRRDPPPGAESLASGYDVFLATSPTTCSGGFTTKTQMHVDTNDLVQAVGTTVDLPFDGIFPMTVGTTYTFTTNAVGNPWYLHDIAQFSYAVLVAEFIPN